MYCFRVKLVLRRSCTRLRPTRGSSAGPLLSRFQDEVHSSPLPHSPRDGGKRESFCPWLPALRQQFFLFCGRIFGDFRLVNCQIVGDLTRLETIDALRNEKKWIELEVEIQKQDSNACLTSEGGAIAVLSPNVLPKLGPESPQAAA